MSTMSRIDGDAHTPKPVFRRYAHDQRPRAKTLESAPTFAKPLA